MDEHTGIFVATVIAAVAGGIVTIGGAVVNWKLQLRKQVDGNSKDIVDLQKRHQECVEEHQKCMEEASDLRKQNTRQQGQIDKQGQEIDKLKCSVNGVIEVVKDVTPPAGVRFPKITSNPDE